MTQEIKEGTVQKGGVNKPPTTPPPAPPKGQGGTVDIGMIGPDGECNWQDTLPKAKRTPPPTTKCASNGSLVVSKEPCYDCPGPPTDSKCSECDHGETVKAIRRHVEAQVHAKSDELLGGKPKAEPEPYLHCQTCRYSVRPNLGMPSTPNGKANWANPCRQCFRRFTDRWEAI